MKTIGLSLLILGTAFGQGWEVGGSAGAAFLPGAAITSPHGAATAGIQPGISFGAFVGQNLYPHISGEVRYGFSKSNLRLQSGGQTATFGGVSHRVHYDVILHTGGKESRTQYFAAVGGGLKFFRGTGQEAAFQELSQFAYFTKTQAIKPMASIGGGIRRQITSRLFLRAEIRDYVTMFPKELITPAPGAKFGGLLHEIVPTIGISYQY